MKLRDFFQKNFLVFHKSPLAFCGGGPFDLLLELFDVFLYLLVLIRGCLFTKFSFRRTGLGNETFFGRVSVLVGFARPDACVAGFLDLKLLAGL